VLKRRDRALEGFAKNPAIAVGNCVEPLDSIGSRLDVELDIPTSAVPPRLRARRALRAERRADSRLTKLAVSEIAFT
jgi:hypothetical protein